VLNDFIQQFRASTRRRSGGRLDLMHWSRWATPWSTGAAADQLRAFRDLHDRHLRHAVRTQPDRAARPLTGLALVGMIVLLLVAAMAVSGGAAVLPRSLPYRPLRKRNAPASRR